MEPKFESEEEYMAALENAPEDVDLLEFEQSSEKPEDALSKDYPVKNNEIQ